MRGTGTAAASRLEMRWHGPTAQWYREPGADPPVDKVRKLRRYQRKDYSQLVDFPVEIVGRDGVVRRYSFEASVRLYQRRIALAPMRYEDQEVVDAEVQHCRKRSSGTGTTSATAGAPSRGPTRKAPSVASSRARWRRSCGGTSETPASSMPSR